MDKIVRLIRIKASSDDDQNIYILAKEVGSIQIFENNRDFTYIQHLFLRYLNFYYTLYSDIAMGEVDKIVMNNHLYEDAYMLYKSDVDKHKFKNKNQEPNKEKIEQSKPTSTWIFKQPNR